MLEEVLLLLLFIKYDSFKKNGSSEGLYAIQF